MIGRIISKNLEILRFYIKTYPILKCLAEAGIGLEMLPESKLGKKPIKISLDKKLGKEYNDEIRKMENELKEKNKGQEEEMIPKLVKFFILRIVLCVLAFYNKIYFTIFVSLFQIIILPYSFIISFTKFLEVLLSIFLGHFIVFPSLILISKIIYPNILEYSITIDNNFIIAFFSIDFLMNLLYSFWTPSWKVKRMSFKRLMGFIFFGTLNSRTYFFILYLLIRGTKVYYILWIIDAIFNLVERSTEYINEKLGMINWGILFYHQHRVAHLPYVYHDAHKFHHYLHDCSPFEAHLYGSGAPEEWHILMSELLPTYFFGLFPPSLNFFSFKRDYDNKLEHIRLKDANDEDISHQDHHLYHIKNFSWCMSLEMYLETSTNNWKNECITCSVTKEIEGDNVIITYIPYIIS